MKQKKEFLLGLSLLVVIGGMFAFASVCRPVQARCNPGSSNTVTEDAQIAPRYIKYSAEALDQARQSDRKVVLYFWAPWCSTCSSLDTEITKNPELIPEDVVILRVPYDSAAELKQKYHVVIQHTFVQIDKSGNPLQVWVGGGSDDFQKKL